jgi:DNA-binding MarR family transcriptional regulator
MSAARRRTIIGAEPFVDDFRCACASARRVARTLTQLYDRSLRSAGLEAPQFALMMTLDKQGPCSQAELGRRYALDKTTVSRNLRLLERNGWIQSSPGRDRRERQFTLAAAGRRCIAAATPRWRHAQEQLRAQLSGGEWDAMFNMFRKITDAAERIPAGQKQVAADRSGRCAAP